MQQKISWESCGRIDSQRNFLRFVESEGPFPRSKEAASGTVLSHLNPINKPISYLFKIININGKLICTIQN